MLGTVGLTQFPSTEPPSAPIRATLVPVSHKQDALQVAVDIFKYADATSQPITLHLVERG